jgi:hypothetical protein
MLSFLAFPAGFDSYFHSLSTMAAGQALFP